MAARRRSLNHEKLLLTILMCLPVLTISLNLDNDFWFLVNQGRYVVEHGFPHTDPFTIHSSFSLVIQQWLFDVVIYFLYETFGKIGVMTLVYLCSFVSLWLIYKLCMLQSENAFYLSSLLTTVCYFVLCLWYMVSRPQIVTYLVFLTELYLLEKYAREGNWKLLLPLPLLSTILINMHAAMWWMLFAFGLPYLIEALVFKRLYCETQKSTPLPLFLSAVAMMGTGLLNPYGIQAVAYVFRSFGNADINSNILEMSPPDIKGLNGAIFFALLFLVVIAYVVNRKGSFRLRYILLSAGTTVLALMSIKSMAYFVLGTLIPLSYYLKNLGDKLVFNKNGGNKQTKFSIAFMGVVIVLAVMVIGDSYDEQKDYPTTNAAVSYLKENEDTSKVLLYTSFYDGGYAEFMGFKAYIDPRAEVFLKKNNKKEDVFQEYIALQSGQLHYKEFLDKYAFTHILVTQDDVLDVYLSQDVNYEIYYKDQNSKIYIPKVS